MSPDARPLGRTPLILDLDGTLLHPERLPDALAVPGRTRNSWLGQATLRSVARLAPSHTLVLATARSWLASEVVFEALAAAGAPPAGLVMEDGGQWGAPGALRALEPTRDWAAVQRAMVADGAPAEWLWQRDFLHCLVVHAGTPARARAWAPQVLAMAAQHADRLKVHTDGSKVYVTGAEAHKANALRALLGTDFERARGIGDGANDLCWLPRVAYPATLAGANPAVRAAVRAQGGYVSAQRGHAGIVEILDALDEAG